MAIEAWQVPLWDAINRYVVACGGDPGKHVYGNTTRQAAVVDVCGVVRSATHAAEAEASGLVREVLTGSDVHTDRAWMRKAKRLVAGCE